MSYSYCEVQSILLCSTWLVVIGRWQYLRRIKPRLLPAPTRGYSNSGCMMPFGLCNALSKEHLESVLRSLGNTGLKVKPSKCQLFKWEVTFLGHVVSGQGITTDLEKIRVVQDWQDPTCVEEVRSFHGFCSYCRSFVPGFATICHLIMQLTMKGVKFLWSEECRCAFEQLKRALCTSPMLAYADSSEPTTLDTDASGVGVGTVLSQKDPEGKERVLGYASRAFNKPERTTA